MPGERWDAGGIEKAVGVVDGARCHPIAALGEECRDLLVLLFCLAGVVRGETEELWASYPLVSSAARSRFRP